MTPPVEIDLDITSLTPDGDGAGRHGSATVTVPFTIPGERVRVRPGRRTAGGTVAGELVEVLAPSPHRVTPRCRHFGGCGGCTLQHIAYPEQLRLKTAMVDALVRAALPNAPRVRPMRPATPVDDPWGYRHKVHFVFGRDGAPAMGHYVRGSRRVLPVVECPVHDPRGNAVAFRFADALGRRADVRALAIRVGANTAELMTTLVVAREGDRALRNASRRALAASPDVTSFHVNVHARDDAFIFGRQTRRISGTERMREEVADTAFLLSPTAFFQTNVRAAAVLVALVADAIPDAARVLDLYAGTGLFALPLARRGHRVLAIEENRDAVEDARVSLRLNRLAEPACRFVARRVEDALAAVDPADAAVVVLDPPREGCARGVIDEVFGRLRPAQAFYVSCNPEALAADLARIDRLGYRPAWIRPVDMFPHTMHVETVVEMRRM